MRVFTISLYVWVAGLGNVVFGLFLVFKMGPGRSLRRLTGVLGANRATESAGCGIMALTIASLSIAFCEDFQSHLLRYGLAHQFHHHE